MSKKNFVQLDETKWPATKGRRIDGMRFYEIDGKNYPSITTVLGAQKKPGLEQWRRNVGEEAANWEMGRAARRGKATHTLVEQYLKGETPAIRDVLPLGLFRLLKPYLEKVDNIHALEKIMYSHEYTIAGQVDCIAEYEGKLSVIDFKTSKKRKPESWIQNYFVQAAAYSFMFEERTNIQIPQLVIMIGVDGDDEPQVFTKNTKERNQYLLQFLDLRKQFDQK